MKSLEEAYGVIQERTRLSLPHTLDAVLPSHRNFQQHTVQSSTRSGHLRHRFPLLQV